MVQIPQILPIKAKVDIICKPNSYKITETGKTVTTNQYGKPLDGDSLAQALRFHGFPGVLVQAFGDHYKGVSLNDKNLNLTHAVSWHGGAVDVNDITVIGGERKKAARVGNVSVMDGTGNVRLQNLTLLNDADVDCPFMVFMQGQAGLMRLYDVDFLPRDPRAWDGKGMKWNIRSEGLAQWDCRYLSFHKAVEHGGYIDNHQGDSYFLNCIGSEFGRTIFQFTNRKTSGASGFGDLVVMNCITANNLGDGGSDYTFVGNLDGTIYFLGNKSYGNPNGSQGAFVSWTDHDHGAYLNKNGYSTDSLVVADFDVNHVNANRDHMQISGAEQVFIGDWDITGNKTAIALNTSFGGGIDNGKVGLYTWQKGPPSKWHGWKSATKMTDKGQVLTDAQIDALEYVP